MIIQSSWSVGAVNQFHADVDVAPKKEIIPTMRLKNLSIYE